MIKFEKFIIKSLIYFEYAKLILKIDVKNWIWLSIKHDNLNNIMIFKKLNTCTI